MSLRLPYLCSLLALFVICRTSYAIAQTTANQPSAQGATPGNAPVQGVEQELEQEINSEVAAAGNGKTSLTEINKELSNPISSIWALQFQQNTFWLNKPERNVVNLLFQPVLPVSLTEKWNLITRPVIPVFNSTPYVNNSGNLHRVSGFGDTVLVELLSPSPNWSARGSSERGRLSFSRPPATRGLVKTSGRSDRRVYSATLATSGSLAFFRSSGGRSADRARTP